MLAGLELHSSGSCSWMTQPYDLDSYYDQVQALLAMAPCRRYFAHALPQHHHGLTLAGQLALHPHDQSRPPIPLHGGSTDKLLKGMLFDLWQDELELLQSLVTSAGCWPEALLVYLPSPPSDGSSTPPLVDSSDDEEAWGSGDDEEASPPRSPCVTPAMIARLNAWIAAHRPDAVPCALPPCMALAPCDRDAARDVVLPDDYADFG